MKTAIGLGAAFVAVLALIARSADQEAAASGGPRPVSVVASAPFATDAQSRSAAAVEVPEPAEASSSATPYPTAMQAAVQAPTPSVLTARLDSRLGLSLLQRGRIEEIFRLRELEVGAIQKRVLESGYFNPRETDPRLAALREESYVQISMLLDSEQNRVFAELLRTNSINDHLVITVPDSLVLLD